MSFSLKDKNVVGLDVGASSIKTVELEKTADGLAVTAASMVDVIAKKDSARANLARTLRKSFKSNISPAKVVVCGVSGHGVVVSDLKFPLLPPDEIAEAVRFEAMQRIPFDINQVRLAYQITLKDETNIYGVLAAALTEDVEEKRDIVDEALASEVVVDVDGFALLNCFCALETPQPGKTSAILNIGADHITLAMIDAKGIPFIRDISYGADSFIHDIVSETGIDADKVREILFKDAPEALPPQIAEVLNSNLYQLIDDINETLSYYKTQKKNLTIDKVLVCGGFSLARDLVSFLQNQLPVQAVLWNPFDKIESKDTETKHLLEKQGPAFAVAAGLALRSISSKLDIDLLNGSGLRVKSGPMGIALAAVAIIVPVIVAALMIASFVKSTVALSIQQREIEKFTTAIADNTGIVNLNQKLEDEKGIGKKLISEVAVAINQHTQWTPAIRTIAEEMPWPIVPARITLLHETGVNADTNTEKLLRIINLNLQGKKNYSDAGKDFNKFRQRLLASEIIGETLGQNNLTAKFDPKTRNDRNQDVMTCDMVLTFSR